MLKPGDVVLVSVQFTDSSDVKVGPAVVLFEELGNVVIAGVTSNPKMKGIPLTRNEGAIKDSVIKLNYVFTVSDEMVNRVVFHLNQDKKRLLFDELCHRLSKLSSN